MKMIPKSDPNNNMVTVEVKEKETRYPYCGPYVSVRIGTDIFQRNKRNSYVYLEAEEATALAGALLMCAAKIAK